MKGITDKQMEMVALYMSQMTDRQLDDVTEIHKRQRHALNSQNMRALQVGDTVRFTSSRRGNPTIIGNVTKKGNKNILVKEPNGRTFRVPAGMTELVVTI